MKEGLNRWRMCLLFNKRGKKTIQNPQIPEWSGVYMLWSKEMLLYIGSAQNLKKRIAGHLGNGFRHYMVNPDEVWKVSIILTKNVWDAKKLEDELLQLIPTKNNGNWFSDSELFPLWCKGFFNMNKKQKK